MPVELLDPSPVIPPEQVTPVEPAVPAETMPVQEAGQPERLAAQDRQEQIKQRVDHAKMECGFDYTKSPEIGEALEGFYTDHYELADLLISTLDGTTTSEQIDEILGRDDNVLSDDLVEMQIDGLDKDYSMYAPSAREMTRLLAAVIKHEQDTTSPRLTKAMATALTFVFQESSLGVTTIDEPELQTIKDLQTRIETRAVDQADPDLRQSPNGELEWRGRGVTNIVLPSEAGMLARVEHAQKEFWDDTRRGGQLLYHNTGQMDGIARRGALMPRTEQHRRTGEMRAQMAVGDRMHSVVPHWAESYDPSLLYKIGEHRGTIAVPIAEIVRHAPFARDAEYATVKVWDKDEIMPKVPVTIGTKSLTSGNHDYPGRGGSDRVFFASGTQRGDKAPDAYAIPMDSTATFIFRGDDEQANSMRYGLGENFPGRVHVDTIEDAPAKAIALQAAMDQKYKDWVVIPLRRGVFDFRPENMSNNMAAGRPGPNYNANPTIATAA